MNRTCPGCEKVFEARNERHRFCSRECRTKRGGPPCYVCGLPLSGSSGKGANIRRSAGKHKSCFEHGFAYAYDKHGCRCDLCREAKNEVLRGQYARARDCGRPKKRVSVVSVCGHCGVEYVGRPDSRFCSLQCVGLSQRGERYSPSHRRGARVPEDVRNAVYERDDWLCYLCGRKVRLDVGYKHMEAPTLDHVVPRSEGGQDTLENLRLAHRLCNSVKRDLTVGEARAELRSLGVCV